jgi:exopolyphosphatase/guanosine-5'-triphosphate,3'-diphosphate pyrophosphatase
LTWAARIHEIGLAIAHSQHHIHGAYIVENSDLAGFARHEQLMLAVILRCHRRKPDQSIIDILPERLRRSGARVTALLRLAVLLQRARGSEALPAFELKTEDKALQLRLPQSWIEAHPLTRTDLDQERDYLKHIDIKLQVKASDKLATA